MRAKWPSFSPLWVLIFLVLGLIIPISFNACGEFQSNRFTEIPDHSIEDQGDEFSIDNPNESLPSLSGMFLKIESTYSGCKYVLTAPQWMEEFSAMKRIGVRYVVLQNTITSDSNGHRLYPDPRSQSRFQPSLCPNGEMQVPFLLNAAAAHGIGVWLGGIWHHYQTGESFKENLKDLYLPERGNHFQTHSAYRGVYLSSEQTLTPNMAHRPYQESIRVATEIFRGMGTSLAYAVSPTYYNFDYPGVRNIPQGCPNFYRSPTITLKDAKPSLEQLIRQVPELELIMVQDKAGFQYVGLFNMSNFFGKPYGFSAAANLRSADQLAWNLEAFHLEGTTCDTLKITTAPWTKVRRALLEAKEAGVKNIISYEWFTNWSPRFAPSGGPSLYSKYLALIP